MLSAAVPAARRDVLALLLAHTRLRASTPRELLCAFSSDARQLRRHVDGGDKLGESGDAPQLAAPRLRVAALVVELKTVVGHDNDAVAARSRSRSGQSDEMLRDVYNVTRRARFGEKTEDVHADILAVQQKHLLGLGGANTQLLNPTASSQSSGLRMRREDVWTKLMDSSAEADLHGVGFILRGFFRDHGRVMDGSELDELDRILQIRMADLAAFLDGTDRVPPDVGAMATWKLCYQYARFWTGSGHERGGEYR
jgi:hypothetical protein